MSARDFLPFFFTTDCMMKEKRVYFALMSLTVSAISSIVKPSGSLRGIEATAF
jgi:hypothetical protein